MSCSGAVVLVVQRADSQHRAVSSNPARVTITTPLARKATGNHAHKIYFPR